jgi:hypothetical protein
MGRQEEEEEEEAEAEVEARTRVGLRLVVGRRKEMGFRGLWKMGFRFGGGRRRKEMGFQGLWKMGCSFCIWVFNFVVLCKWVIELF